jgi:hypothetical protein
MKRETTAHILAVIFIICLLLAPVGFAGKKEAPPDQTPETEAVEENVTETLMIDWPEEDGWASEFVHNSDDARIEYLYPKGQSSEGWHEMASTELVYDKVISSLPGEARITLLGTQRGCPEATWEIFSKGKNDHGQAHVVYEIICPEFLNKEPAQVQLWAMLKGKAGLYAVQYTFRGLDMPEDRKEQIVDMLEKVWLKVEKAEEE